MTRRDDGLSPGDHGDPVADSIRRQQQADAMPTKDEVQRDHRRRLADAGCEVCGDDDPSHLEQVRVGLHFCGNDQHPRQPFETAVFCDEHLRPAGVLKRARLIQSARNRDADVIARYDCGATVFESWDVPDDDVLAKRLGHVPDDFDSLRLRTKLKFAQPPHVPAFHVGRGCGADLVEVIRID